MRTMTQNMTIKILVLTAIVGLRGLAQADSVVATGGDVVTDIGVEGIPYRLHAFTTPGTNMFAVTSGGEVEFLVVGGGGGGGAGGGGGGAGGFVLSNMTVVAGLNYTVVVGDGGDGAGSNAAETGSNGSDSSFAGTQAIGGGGGGSFNAVVKDGLEGGSGGGAAMDEVASGGTNTLGQGFQGGDCLYWGKGGGGGGASQPGYDGTSGKIIGGKGGAGTNMNYLVGTGFGEDGYFAGGGGGGMHKGLGNTDRSGGLGGGGNGNSTAGYAGLANTGGGGGAGGDYNGTQVGGGDGGAGIVIIRYAVDVDVVFFPEPFTLADITTGSEEFTNSNEVEVTALPVPEGYTHYQITESGDMSAVGGRWTPTSTLMHATFATPAADTRVTLYAWYTNTNAEVLLSRGQGDIYYATVAPPDPPVRPTLSIVRLADQPMEIQPDDLDLGANGGQADGRPLEVLARRVVSAGDPTLDTTPDEAYLTLDGSQPDGDYPLQLWVQNEAGNVTLSSPTLVTVATAAAGTDQPFYRGGSHAGWGRERMTEAQGLGGALVSLSSGTDQTVAWTESALDLATLTIETEVTAGRFANGDTIRVSVPADWQSRFDTGVTVTYGGNASGKVAPATFSGDGHTLQIPVTRDFVAGDRLTLSGLKLVDLFLARGDTRRLELDYTGDGVRDVYDDYQMTITVVWSGGTYDGFDDAATTKGDTVR